MQERIQSMTYDFDKVYDRRGTNSLKWDCAKDRHHSEDELPLWVADMDFKAPEPIIKAVHDVTDKGFFGYTVDMHDDRKIVCDWLERRHGYAYDPEDIIFTPGVVYALTQAVIALTEDKQIIIPEIREKRMNCILTFKRLHTPVYKKTDIIAGYYDAYFFHGFIFLLQKRRYMAL